MRMAEVTDDTSSTHILKIDMLGARHRARLTQRSVSFSSMRRLRA
jgi:hypothetical protein